MDELGLAVRVLAADARAARLEGFEVAARGDFQPRVVPRRPELQIVAFRRREGHVAVAQPQDAVVEAQAAQDVFGVGHQRFEFVVAGLGRHELDELDLVELVDADEPARVLARRARFAPEAGGVRHELQRQRGANDLFAVVVGDGDFGGRDQPEVVLGAVVHVFGHLGELAGAGHGRGGDEVGGADLGVAVLLGVHVQHVRDERPLEFRADAREEREPGAAHARRAREVEEAQLLAQRHVVLGLEVEFARLAPGAVHDVVLGAEAARHAAVREVRDGQDQALLLGLDFADLRVEGGDLFADGLGLGLNCGGVLAGALEFADFLGDGVALALEGVGFGDGRAAAGVEVQYLRDVHGGAAVLQAFADGVGVVADEFDVEHGGSP